MQPLALQKKAAGKRAFGFAAILCAILLLAAIILGYLILSTAEKGYLGDTERSLMQQSQERVARLTTWSGSLQSLVETFSQSDMVTLLAAEMAREQNHIHRVLDKVYDINHSRRNGGAEGGVSLLDGLKPAAGAEATQPAADTQTPAVPGADVATPTPAATGATPDAAPPANADEPLQVSPATESMVADIVDELAHQAVRMRKLLIDFAGSQKFDAVSMLTLDGVAYVSTLDPLPVLTPNQRHGLSQVTETGRPRMLPTRRNGDGALIMDMLYPVMPPSYMQENAKKAVGVLLVSVNVTDLVQRLRERTRGDINIQSQILQPAETGLVSLVGLVGAKDPVRHTWQLDKEGNLPFAIRTLPDQKVYSLGLDVPDIPWLIATEIPVSVAREAYEHYRQTVLIVLTAVTIVLMVFTCVGWWSFVGKRDRAMQDHVNELYRQNSQQKMLVENINTHLTDAIVLKDRAGKIFFCNDAYAAFFGKYPADIIEKNADELMDTMTNLPNNPYIQEVLDTGETVTYSEVLLLSTGKSTFQVVSSPFRNEHDEISGVVCVYRDLTSLLQAQERTQRMAYQTIQVLVRAIEAADPYLAGQSMRLAELSQTLVRMMGLDAMHAATVRSAANLSQVGMLQVPSKVRCKQGRLTDEERTLLQKHVEYARIMLEGIDFGLPVQQAIYQMHEKMDGTGYPNHLKGKDICIDARILAVANTFCAVLRPRAYRQARGVDEALKILALDNPQYDPEVIRVLHAFVRGPLGPQFVESLSKGK